MISIVKSLGKSEQFRHFLSTTGNIVSVPLNTEVSRPQSLSIAIKLAKESK